MKLAYADPPYPRQAKRHYKNDPSGIPAEEVNSAELLKELLKNYDGFALSTNEPGIEIIKDSLPKGYFKQHEIRIGVWVKPFCSWKPTHRVQYTWEPVLYHPVRPNGNKSIPSVRDHIIVDNGKDACVDCFMLNCCRQIPSVAVRANITLRKGTHGAKPDAFCDWILDIIGYQSGDQIDDLFPGTGAMSQAVDRRGGEGGQREGNNSRRMVRE